MANNKTMGIVLLALGAVLLILSLAADAVGIGGSASFGYKQTAGVFVGVIAVVAGFILYSKK